MARKEKVKALQPSILMAFMAFNFLFHYTLLISIALLSKDSKKIHLTNNASISIKL